MTNLVQFPQPRRVPRIGPQTLEIECIRCPRYVLSNALNLAEMRTSLRNHNWWSAGPISTCPECLDGASCPECGHDNCDRYWTNVRIRQERCGCHGVVDLLDLRLERALSELGAPPRWMPGTPLPDLPVIEDTDSSTAKA